MPRGVDATNAARDLRWLTQTSGGARRLAKRAPGCSTVDHVGWAKRERSVVADADDACLVAAPRALHLGLFTAAYILACGFTKSLAIVPGTGISIWPAGGLFIATLVLSSRNSWPWWLSAGRLAELFSNVLWFHNPLPAATRPLRLTGS